MGERDILRLSSELYCRVVEDVEMVGSLAFKKKRWNSTWNVMEATETFTDIR